MTSKADYLKKYLSPANGDQEKKKKKKKKDGPKGFVAFFSEKSQRKILMFSESG